MELSAIHDSLDDIPEQYRELYTEKGDKFELTGIRGIKTQADIDRLDSALKKEKNDHKATKVKLQVWGELDHDDIMGKLDRIPELEAASKGNLDEAQIEEIVQRRVEGTLRSRIAPVERERDKFKRESEERGSENKELRRDAVVRTINDDLMTAMTEAKVRPEAFEDVKMYGERLFEVAEDGRVITRDQVGTTPGLPAKEWLSEMQAKRPHWWPDSQGGGARGNDGRGGGITGENPWSYGAWNMTKQGEFLKTNGQDKAVRAAQSAGTTLGGPRPPAPKE